jgi:hypothetical protein
MEPRQFREMKREKSPHPLEKANIAMAVPRPEKNTKKFSGARKPRDLRAAVQKEPMAKVESAQF